MLLLGVMKETMTNIDGNKSEEKLNVKQHEKKNKDY